MAVGEVHDGLPDNVAAPTKPLAFAYESTGVETRFTNSFDPEPSSRQVFTFHRPRHAGRVGARLVGVGRRRTGDLLSKARPNDLRRRVANLSKKLGTEIELTLVDALDSAHLQRDP